MRETKSRLVSCSLCDKKISSNAKSCPGCGEPNGKHGARETLIGDAALIFGFVTIYDMLVRTYVVTLNQHPPINGVGFYFFSMVLSMVALFGFMVTATRIE